MPRRIESVLGFALIATLLGGCVADPYYYDRRGGGYNRPTYSDRPSDDYPHDYRPPPQHHDRDADKRATLVCASKDGRAKRCRTDFPIGRAEVDKRYSSSPCDYGRSWGYDGNEVWVDRGCRARFRLYPAGRRR